MNNHQTENHNTDKKKLRVIILGGGLSGLVAADKLLDSNKFDVTILEGAPFLGGLASSFSMEGEEIPRFNHHIVSSNTKTLEYLKRYNLLGKNKWQRVKMGFGVDGKIHNINNPLGLLKFNYLSLWGKFRLGLFGLYTIFLLNPDRIDDKMDLDTWMNKYAGKEVKEKIWKQLYGRNKFNISLKEISAKQFAHRLYEKEGYDKFTYPTKGLQGMIDGLEKDIKSQKGIILSPTKITHVDLDKKNVEYIHNMKKHVQEYDIIINTIPIPELIKFTKGLPKKYSDNIKKLRYVPVVGLCWGTKDFPNKKLYWVNLFNERVHVVYQHSLLIDKYKSKVTWCVRYGGSEEDLEKSDSEIRQIYMETLHKYFPGMQVKWCKVFREKYAEPIYDKNYSKYAPNYDTPISTLFNTGIQVTFPKIRNMNVALESGEIVAEKILKKFG
jgi:protoporphyrinogen oxidase